MKKPIIDKILKRGYRFFRQHSNLIDLSGGFMMILAFVMVLPQMAEFQYAWLGAFLTMMVALKIAYSKFEQINPKLKLEYDFKLAIDDLENKIKKIERRVKKHENKKTIHMG
jgi:hypothetical protein